MVTQLQAGAEGRIRATTSSIRQSFRQFWPYVRLDQRFLGCAVLLLVLAAAAETVAIWMYALITDDALAKASLTGFWRPAGIWAGMALISGLASFAAGWLTSWVSERFLLRTRDAVYTHLQTLPPDRLANHDSGDLVARLTSDLETIDALTASGLVSVVGSVITVLFYSGAALILSWQLSLAAFVLAPLIWSTARVFAKRIKVVATDERYSNGAIGAVVAENLANLTLIQAYSQEHAERERLHAKGVSWMRARVRESKLGNAYTPVVDLAELLCLLMVIAFGIWQISTHKMTLGEVLAYTVYIGYLYPPLRQLGTLTVTASAAAASSDRIAELLAARPDIIESPSAGTISGALGEIRLDRVGYRYPSGGEPALRDVSCTIRPGQLVLVTGASGAGKSTITKLLLRFADPSAGRILLDGTDLRGLTLASLRCQISLVPQHTQVFHATVRVNLAYGRPNATDEEIVAAAITADAHQFILDLPQGYATMLDGQGQRLSGGQLRRLAIARALLRDSPVLVLDEPTAGLDAHASARVLQPVQRLAGIKTTLIISHDLSIAAHADAILMLDNGRLIEHGTHAELLRLGGRYAKLYRQHQTGRDQTPHLPAPDTGRWKLRGTLNDPNAPRPEAGQGRTGPARHRNAPAA